MGGDPEGRAGGDVLDPMQLATAGFFVLQAAVSILVTVALGAYLRWRWMFWGALIVTGLGGIGALTNLSNFANPSRSYSPIWGVAVNELLSLASLALFVWLLVGVIKFGPWAMKRPSA